MTRKSDIRPSLASIKAILWDLDDTLWDFTETFNLVSLKFSKADVPECLKDRATVMLVMGEITKQKPEIAHNLTRVRQLAFEEILTKKCNLDATEAKAASAKYFDIWYKYRNEPVFFRGVRDELARLKARGLIFGVVTDGNADARTIKGIAEHLDGPVITAELAGCKKPNAKIFHMALDMLENVEPHEVLFVGDSWPKDILGAHAVGMKTAYICGEPVVTPEGEPPTMTLSTVADLGQYFEST